MIRNRQMMVHAVSVGSARSDLPTELELWPQRRKVAGSPHGPPSLGMLLAVLPSPMLLLSVLMALPKLLGIHLWPWWVAALPMMLPVSLGAASLALIVTNVWIVPRQR